MGIKLDLPGGEVGGPEGGAPPDGGATAYPSLVGAAAEVAGGGATGAVSGLYGGGGDPPVGGLG